MMRKLGAIICAFTLFLWGITPNKSIFARAQEQTLETEIVAIENALAAMGTDVVSELEKQKNGYESALVERALTDDERLQAQELILMTDDLIFQYQERLGDKKGWLKDNFIYLQAIASVVAYFIANEYYLSAELLTHMQYNNQLDSVYRPFNVENVPLSSVTEGIRASKELQGSSRFPKAGTAKEVDLFYSVHQFSYAKFDGGETVVIYDRYDYAPDGKFELFDNIPIQVMYAAQEAGVLVPYYTLIELKTDGENADAAENFNRIARAEGEYHLFTDGCDESCCVGGCAYVRSVSDHTDGDADGKCDECFEQVALDGQPENPDASEQPLLPPVTEATPPEKEENPFGDIKNGVKGFWNKIEEFMDGSVDVVQENLGGCSGSLSGVSGVVAPALIASALFIKKRKKK